MRPLASLVLTFATLASACMVGEDKDPPEDAAAGAGLSEEDLSGTDIGKGDGTGTLSARVCANGATTQGIDVSYYQGNIDWARVKAAGVEFAFIRISDGANFRDPQFARNWENAKAANVVRGAYQFFRPSQSIPAQAQLMINAIGAYQPGDLPPVIDVEADGGQAPAVVAQRVKQWVDLVKAATGAVPVVYTGKYFWRDDAGGSRALADHALWIAQYTSKCPDLPAPWTRWTFWQNTSRGRVDGIHGNVDLDKFNGSLDALRAFAANGSVAPADDNRAEPLPFSWTPGAEGDVTFAATPPAGVATVEVRVEDYLVGMASASSGTAALHYAWNAKKLGRTVEVRGLDANGATVAVGNGLVDSTDAPEVFVRQVGALEYEIGLASPAGAATIEVFADGFPLSDTISGRTKSPRGVVQYAWTQGSERALRIIARDASGDVIATFTRTLFVR